MARRRRWYRRQQRLFAQAMILVLVIGFLSLGSPKNRATANTILGWLVLRFAIGVLILLALWWAWEYARPPKVKRRKHKSRKAKGVKSPSISTTNRTITTTPISGENLTDPTPPMGIPLTRDALTKTKMSGAHPLWPHSEDE